MGGSQPVRRRREKEGKEEREETRERGKEKRKREKKERKGKGKKKRNRRRLEVSSSVHWRFGSRYSLNQGVKSRDSTRAYASRSRDSSFFGLLLAFGLLYWIDFGTVLCHVNGMGWVYSRFKGLLSEPIWVEKFHLREFPKCSYNPRAHYFLIGSIVL